MKYLLITEDQSLYLSESYTDEDLLAIADGILTIVRLDTGQELNGNGEWEEIPVYEAS